MKQLSIIAIRLLSIYLIVSVLNSMLPFLLDDGSRESLINASVMVIIGYTVIPIVTGIILWFFAPRLSASIPEESEKSPTADDLVSAGTFLIGVYLFVEYFGYTIGHINFRMSRDNIEHYYFDWGLPVTMLLGLCLIIGNKQFVKLFHKLRYGAR